MLDWSTIAIAESNSVAISTFVPHTGLWVGIWNVLFHKALENWPGTTKRLVAIRWLLWSKHHYWVVQRGGCLWLVDWIDWIESIPYWKLRYCGGDVADHDVLPRVVAVRQSGQVQYQFSLVVH